MPKKSRGGVLPAWLTGALGGCTAAAAAGWAEGIKVFLLVLPLWWGWRLLSSRLGRLGGAVQFTVALALALVIPIGRMVLVARLVLWGAMVMLVAVEDPKRLFVPGAGLLVLAGRAASNAPAPSTFVLMVGIAVLLMAAATAVAAFCNWCLPRMGI